MKRLAMVVCTVALVLAACGDVRAPAPPPPPAASAAPAEASAKRRTRPPSARELFKAPPKSDYEAAVTSAVKVVLYAEGLKPFCGRWFPSYIRQNIDAYETWNARNGTTAKDIKDRARKLWQQRAGEHEKAADYVFPYLRRDLDGLLQREFDSAPVKEFEEICSGLSKSILSREWDLERKLKSELAAIRKGA